MVVEMNTYHIIWTLAVWRHFEAVSLQVFNDTIQYGIYVRWKADEMASLI